MFLKSQQIEIIRKEKMQMYVFYWNCGFTGLDRSGSPKSFLLVHEHQYYLENGRGSRGAGRQGVLAVT